MTDRGMIHFLLLFSPPSLDWGEAVGVEDAVDKLSLVRRLPSSAVIVTMTVETAA